VIYAQTRLRSGRAVGALLQPIGRDSMCCLSDKGTRSGQVKKKRESWRERRGGGRKINIIARLLLFVIA